MTRTLSPPLLLGDTTSVRTLRLLSVCSFGARIPLKAQGRRDVSLWPLVRLVGGTLTERWAGTRGSSLQIYWTLGGDLGFLQEGVGDTPLLILRF